jgi:hypothetical protein
MLIVIPTEGRGYKLGGQLAPEVRPAMQQVYGTSDFEIGWAYVKQVEIVRGDRSSHR